MSWPVGSAVWSSAVRSIIEAGAVGCLPKADHASWGPECDYCEGVRLAFDCEKFLDAEILRAKGRPRERATPVV